MRTPLVLLTSAALAAASGVLAAAAPVPTRAPASPDGTPALPAPPNFARTIDNPWFPLRPGTVLTYRGEDEGVPATDVLRVTHLTRPILGIRATVIDDRVYKRGVLAERTTDWYAQDRPGNVWYLGERTATLRPDGRVQSTEGTWRVGVHGARAGIFMPANPRVGAGGIQEHYPGHAEDRYRILSLRVAVRTPGASSARAMLVQERTRLEPGVLDHKVYVRGIGTVREETVRGGNERYTLMRVQRG